MITCLGSSTVLHVRPQNTCRYMDCGWCSVVRCVVLVGHTWNEARAWPSGLHWPPNQHAVLTYGATLSLRTIITRRSPLAIHSFMIHPYGPWFACPQRIHPSTVGPTTCIWTACAPAQKGLICHALWPGLPCPHRAAYIESQRAIP
jgi:hypothetical protein